MGGVEQNKAKFQQMLYHDHMSDIKKQNKTKKQQNTPNPTPVVLAISED